jgi:hypothetical protein
LACWRIDRNATGVAEQADASKCPGRDGQIIELEVGGNLLGEESSRVGRISRPFHAGQSALVK